MYACNCLCISVCLCLRVFAYVYVSGEANANILCSNIFEYIHMRAHKRTHTHPNTRVRICKRAREHTRLRPRERTITHPRTHKRLRVKTRRHTHANIYIYMCAHTKRVHAHAASGSSFPCDISVAQFCRTIKHDFCIIKKQ